METIEIPEYEIVMIMEKMKKNDVIGFALGKKHYKIVRDE